MHHGETTHALLNIHYFLQLKYKKTYTSMTRAKALKLLKRIHGIKIGLSALDKQYSKFKRVGLMNMYPQPRQRDDGTWYMLATNRALTFNGLKHLKRFVGNIARWLWLWGLKTVGIKKESRGPKLEGPQFKFTPPPRRDDNPFRD